MNTVTVTVPLTIRRRGGRKLVVAPDGAAWAPARARVDSTLVKALARAFRWRRMLEEGRYGSLNELAAAEKINSAYVSRVLRLSLLAPEIVEEVMDGRQPVELTACRLLEPLSLEWTKQRATLLRNTPHRTDASYDVVAPRSHGGPQGDNLPRGVTL
jgi:hypothetical protein